MSQIALIAGFRWDPSQFRLPEIEQPSLLHRQKVSKVVPQPGRPLKAMDFLWKEQQASRRTYDYLQRWSSAAGNNGEILSKLSWHQKMQPFMMKQPV